MDKAYTFPFSFTETRREIWKDLAHIFMKKPSFLSRRANLKKLYLWTVCELFAYPVRKNLGVDLPLAVYYVMLKKFLR
ncbi:MAG: hypothetical protein RMJ39_10035 [Deltaproteobacteria bacterium]|nr:hypothetical protein [Deltaproteobacteria bacterium]